MSDLSEALAENDMADDEEAAAVRRSGWRIWLKRLSVAAAVVVVLPFVLTPLYLFVRPVSTLMIGDLLTLQGYSRQWVDIEDIAPSMQQAVVMSLIVLGEAATKVMDQHAAFAAEHSQIPWRNMRHAQPHCPWLL